MKLYVDMDGVLTDFVRQLADMLGVHKDPGNDPKVWSRITKAGKAFWSTMHWMSDGGRLWQEVKKYEPTILSSPSGHPSCLAGKKKWIRENIPGTPFIPEHKKEKYAAPGAILIDDRRKNIVKWERAGGIGILHRNTADTILQIRKAKMKLSKHAAIKSIEDPKDPKRKIVIEKLRGGRGTQVIKPKKGPGSYKRKKNWHQDVEASMTQRVMFRYAGWWKIDSVEKGQIDFDQPEKKDQLLNAIPGEDPSNVSYNGDGPADAMGDAVKKISKEYLEAWHRMPKRDELKAVFNFCTNNTRLHGEDKGYVIKLARRAMSRFLSEY